jgi:hypothetical protein
MSWMSGRPGFVGVVASLVIASALLGCGGEATPTSTGETHAEVDRLVAFQREANALCQDFAQQGLAYRFARGDLGPIFATIVARQVDGVRRLEHIEPPPRFARAFRRLVSMLARRTLVDRDQQRYITASRPVPAEREATRNRLTYRSRSVARRLGLVSCAF